MHEVNNHDDCCSFVHHKNSSFTEHRKSVVLVFVLSQEALKQLASLVVTGVRTVSMYLKQ